MESLRKYLPNHWHSFFIDGIFIVLSFTFFPLIGWLFVEWFEIWLLGKGDNFRQVLFFSSVLAFLAIICRIVSVYLKRLPIRKRNKEFESGKFLAWLNFIAIFATYLIAYVGLVEIFWGDTRSKDFPALIFVSIFLVLVSVAFFVEYKLFAIFDKPLKFKSENSAKAMQGWRFSPITEIFVDGFLFIYILVLQCFYYAYMAETLDNRLERIQNYKSGEDYMSEVVFSVFIIFLVFLFLYAAPRLIYSKSYDEDTNYWMLGLVFISSIIGFFLPKSIAWLF